MPYRDYLAIVQNPSFEEMNPVKSLFLYGKNVLTNRQFFWHLFWMILFAETLLGIVIIHFVPCKLFIVIFME